MRLSSRRGDIIEFRRRYRWMVGVVFLAFFLLVFRLAQLQIVEHERHRAQARSNITGRVTLATTRGVIRDSRGRILAANRPSYNVYVVPKLIDMEKTWPRLVELTGMDPETEESFREKIEAIREGQDGRELQQILLTVDVSRDVFAALKTHKSDLRGVDIAPSPVRYYPYGELGAHLIGYMKEIDGETLARLEDHGYRSGDRLGAVGVERRWESYLRGRRGWQKVIRGRLTRQRDNEELEERYLEAPLQLEPIPGRDVTLTLDIELERSIEKALRGQLAGAVVVVDVRTGRLLASLSKPSFDPNVVSGGSGKNALRDAFKRLYADPLKPTLDKTTSAAYPPGSTYKPFTALAALADRLITPQSETVCRGGYEFGRRYFRCTGVHGKVRLHSALVQSCNTYFYALGELIHIDRLAKIGLDYGFGMKTGLGINPESRGRMPTRAWYSRRYKGEGFRGGFTLLAAIGQGATTVTVLQLALSYAALANGGTLYQPQVVRSIETSDGTVVQEFGPRVRDIVDADPTSVRLVNEALRDVVYDRRGTAHAESIPGVDLAGKTGTAQVTHVTPKGVDPKRIWYFNRDHAWFAGFAPTGSPEIAIVVLVEHGGGGGKNAAPVAMQVVRDYTELKAKYAKERIERQVEVSGR